MSICACGCGQATTIYRGEPRRFLRGHATRGRVRPSAERQRLTEAAWRGGRTNNRGYVYIYVGRDHPMADQKGYALEHRLVMAEKIGRPLTAEEIVHHEDGNRQNNDPANLRLFASHSEHKQHEHAFNREAREQRIREAMGAVGGAS